MWRMWTPPSKRSSRESSKGLPRRVPPGSPCAAGARPPERTWLCSKSRRGARVADPGTPASGAIKPDTCPLGTRCTRMCSSAPSCEDSRCTSGCASSVAAKRRTPSLGRRSGTLYSASRGKKPRRSVMVMTKSDMASPEFRSEGSSSKLTLRLKEVAVRLTRLNEHQLSSWGAKNVDTVREEAKARVQYTSARDKEPSEVVARAASWTPAVGQDVEDVDTTIEEVIERVLQGAPKEGPTRVTLCRRHSASRKDLVVLKEPQGSESGRPGDPCQWCHQARHVSTGHALYKDVFFCSVMRGQSVDQWLRKQRGGQAEDTIPRTTEWNLVQRLKREEAQEERDGDDEEAPRRKKSKPYKLRICQQCGQPKQKDYGHCQYGGQHYCALYGCKTARLWLAEKRQRKAP
ncbi:uncharacterized protein LOC128765389 isoform X2 [Synchiropus splendidus]|uniref:uncharacterized protein LOC128765389 isoform X2 n=1 Tax=Synchiropus splendidus TaxID=270530 RepID=UPI00237E165F|nr:uncharacterized protein LOC128765389 isoform X2 [Synchiropus splendidus]